MRNAHAEYINGIIEKWKIGEQPKRFQASMRRVLGELSGMAQHHLYGSHYESPVQAVMLNKAGFSVWSFFPVRNRDPKQHVFGYVMPKVRLCAEAQVLLAFGPTQAARETDRFFEDCLRDHLGHTLLYLRNPLASNTCSNAQAEWRKNLL